MGFVMKIPKLAFLLSKKWEAELFRPAGSAAERLLTCIMQGALQKARQIAIRRAV
jgi:hypothetical protein